MTNDTKQSSPVPVKAQFSLSDLVSQAPIAAILIYGIEKLGPIIQSNTEVLGQVLEALRQVKVH